MSLLTQPGITLRDLIEVYPVTQQPDPRGKSYGYTYVAGDPVRVYSHKASAREAYHSGKEDATASYTLYADAKDAASFTEKGYLWHPEYGLTNPGGTPNVNERLLNVSGVLSRGDLVVVEASITI